MSAPRSLTLLFLLSCPALLPAQQPAGKAADVAQLEAELARTAIQKLVTFARLADSNKVRSRAKEAYERILGYDPEHGAARSALGFRRLNGEWQPAATGKQPTWQDAPSNAQKQRVATAHEQLQQQLGALHRELGLLLQSRGEAERARQHLERAVACDQADAVAHRALGHGEYRGFFGPVEQIGFLQRLAAIEGKAKELGAFDCKPAALPASEMPDELSRAGLPAHGARTAHVTVWATSPPEVALELARWGERAFLLLQFLLGERAVEHDVAGELGQTRWFGLLHSEEEKDRFLQHNKGAFEIDIGLIEDFAGWTIRTVGGRAHVSWGPAGQDRDLMVAHVTQHGFAHRCNEGFSEGLVHAMTWLLLGTVYTFYGTVPETVAGPLRLEDAGPEEWFARLRADIDANKDWPLQQIPRERLDHYRPQVRLKAWSFVVWLLARHPDQWVTLLHAFPKENASLSPEQATNILEQALGRTLPEIEAEWRLWASGTSALAKASGHVR